MSKNDKRGVFFLVITLFIFFLQSLCYPLNSTLAPMGLDTVNRNSLDYSPSTPNLSSLDVNQVNYFSVIITVGNENTDKRDVNSLVTTLVSYGWKESNIRFFSEEKATKQAIITKPFDWLNSLDYKETDVILFYFSMHGGQTEDHHPIDEPDNQDEYLVPYDGDSDNESNILLDDELAMKLKTLHSNNIILIFEACHSGGMIDGLHDLCGPGKVILTSCRADEYSWGLSIQKQWMFPYYLIKGLSGKADINEDDWVSAEEAFTYAEKPTIFHSAFKSFLYLLHPFARLGPQHPQLYDAWPNAINNQDDLKIISLEYYK